MLVLQHVSFGGTQILDHSNRHILFIRLFTYLYIVYRHRCIVYKYIHIRVLIYTYCSICRHTFMYICVYYVYNIHNAYLCVHVCVCASSWVCTHESTCSFIWLICLLQVLCIKLYFSVTTVDTPNISSHHQSQNFHFSSYNLFLCIIDIARASCWYKNEDRRLTKMAE